MMWPNHQIDIGIHTEEANLAIVHNSFVSKTEKWMIGPQMNSAISCTRLSKLDFFGDLQTTEDYWDLALFGNDMFEQEFEYYSNFCGTCDGSPLNQNLSNGQRELLL